MTCRRRGAALSYFLAFVFALFIAILIAVAVIARRTGPVMLDEKGRPASGSLSRPR